MHILCLVGRKPLINPVISAASKNLLRVNNLTVCHFADVSVLAIAIFVFHFCSGIAVDHEADVRFIWFARLIQTVRGIAPVQPVGWRICHRRGFLQSDVIAFV